jgi:CBS domain-containing protein
MTGDQHERNLQRKAEDARISEVPAETFMFKKPVTVQVGSKIFSTVQILKVHNVSGAAVVDSNNHLVGMISEYDLLLQAATRDVAEPITFNKEVFSINPKTTLREILVIFYKKKYRLIPVTDANHVLVGMISRSDVLHRLVTPLKGE